MKLTDEQLEKIRDSITKDALEDASGDTPLRVIMTLRPKRTKKTSKSLRVAALETRKEIPPDSRTEMRRRLIAQKTQARRAELQPIIDELTARSLDVKGGRLRTVVVDGLASDILKGIDVSGVSKVRVDRKVKK